MQGREYLNNNLIVKKNEPKGKWKITPVWVSEIVSIFSKNQSNKKKMEREWEIAQEWNYGISLKRA